MSLNKEVKEIMKKLNIFLAIFALCMIVRSVSAESEQAGSQVIPYAPNLTTLNDEYGADAFDHMLDHKDSRYYIINDFYHSEPGNGLHIIPFFATYQQTTEYTCGCASALMVMNHFGDHSYNELQIAEAAETDEHRGTSVEGLTKFFTENGYEVDSHADTSFRFDAISDAEAYLLEKIDSGIPVMVSWEDWRGHWMVIIGLDTMNTESPYDDVLIMADPYDVTDHYQDGYYTYPFGRFFDMWREGPCVEKAIPYEQPFVAAWPANGS